MDDNVNIRIKQTLEGNSLPEVKAQLKAVRAEMNTCNRTTAEGAIKYSQLSTAAGKLSTRVVELTREQKGLEAQTKKTSSGFSSFSNSLNGISDKISGIALSIGGVIAGLVSVASLKKAFDFVKEVTLTAARTQTLGIVVQQVGKIAGYTANEVEGYVEAVKRMGITTQAARITLTRFFQLNLDVEKAAKLARVAQDAAVVGGINSSEALEGLIHGISTQQIRVLRTYGIMISAEREYADYKKKHRIADGYVTTELSAETKQRILLNAVIREGAKLQGTYEAAMETPAKMMSTLARYAEEAANKLGTGFLSAMKQVVIVIGDVLKNDRLISFFADLFRAIGDGVSKVITFAMHFGKMVSEVMGGEKTFDDLKATLIKLVNDGFKWLVDVLENKVLPAYRELYTTIKNFIDTTPGFVDGLKLIAGVFASMAVSNFVRVINIMDKIIWFLDKIKYLTPPFWFMKLYNLTQTPTDPNTWSWKSPKVEQTFSSRESYDVWKERQIEEETGDKKDKTGRTGKTETEEKKVLSLLAEEIKKRDELNSSLELNKNDLGAILEITKKIEAANERIYFLQTGKNPWYKRTISELGIVPKDTEMPVRGYKPYEGGSKPEKDLELAGEKVSAILDVATQTSNILGVGADTFIGKMLSGFGEVLSLADSFISLLMKFGAIGGNAASGGIFGIIGSIFGLSGGTDNWQGGWALVGDDRGKPTPYSELINLPQGSRVFNNKDTMSMLNSGVTALFGGNSNLSDMFQRYTNSGMVSSNPGDMKIYINSALEKTKAVRVINGISKDVQVFNSKKTIG